MFLTILANLFLHFLIDSFYQKLILLFVVESLYVMVDHLIDDLYFLLDSQNIVWFLVVLTVKLGVRVLIVDRKQVEQSGTEYQDQ